MPQSSLKLAVGSFISVDDHVRLNSVFFKFLGQATVKHSDLQTQ